MAPAKWWGRGFWREAVLLLFLVPTSIVFSRSSSNAQEALHTHPLGRIDEPGVSLPQEQYAMPPLAPKDVSPALALDAKAGISSGPRVFVREIKVDGSTVFSVRELAAVTSPYLNRELTSEDLETLRRALTLLYIERGYINSGAILPDQTVVDGVINYQAVEGKITNIEVEGNKWLRGSYYRNRLALDADPPVNLMDLQRRLQLLQQDDRIRQVHAELKPGMLPGESELKVEVKESPPIAAAIGFNNYQSPSVGAERGFISLSDKSLTGIGDILSFTYSGSEGVNPEIDAWYTLPITPRDTTVALHYQKNEFNVVEAPFKPLKVESRSDTYGITLRQPLYRSPNLEFAVALSGEREHNESFLLDEPFSFAPGEENGKSTVTALRFSQELLYRTQTQVLAARSRFSFGIDALGSTIHSGPEPDGRFFSWLGQFQWASLLGRWGIQSIFRTDIQLAADSLLPLEQVPVGGRYSVRGYRENEFVRDNAVIASMEVRIPLIREAFWADYVQIAPFVDFGKAWNTDLPTPREDLLLSTGIGLRWALTLLRRPFPVRPEFEVYWGYPIERTNSNGNGLQGMGVHVQFTVTAF